MADPVLKYAPSGECEICEERDDEILEDGVFEPAHPNCECSYYEAEDECYEDEELNDMKCRLGEIINDLSTLDDEYQTTKEMIEGLESAISAANSELETAVNELRDNPEEIIDEYLDKDTPYDDLEDIADEINDAIETAVNELYDELYDEHNIEENQELRDDLLGKLEDFEREIEELTEEKEDLETKIEEYEQ